MTEQDDDLPTPPASTVHAHRLFKWGVAVSVIYVAALGTYASFVQSAMSNMKPDEFATFLSGVFAPLAFLWLVLGFRQQGDELQNSARALWLQGEELRNSVEQQRQLVEVSREQLTSERASRLRAEEEAEHAAQPRLVVPRIGGSYSGPERTLSVYINSAGPTCSDYRVFFNESEVTRGPLLVETGQANFSVHYATPDEVKQSLLRIEYTDIRGNRRAQQYIIPVAENGGPNRDRTLGEPVRIGGVEKIPPSAVPEGS